MSASHRAREATINENQNQLLSAVLVDSVRTRRQASSKQFDHPHQFVPGTVELKHSTVEKTVEYPDPGVVWWVCTPSRE